MNRREMWAWLSGVDGIYYTTIKKMLKKIGSIEEIYDSDLKRLIDKGGIGEEEAEKIIKAKECFDAGNYFKKLDSYKIKFVTVDDKEYPKKLMPYEHKPYYLFYKGKLPDETLPAVAMVGARACSNYGRNIARTISKELSLRGVQIISGMARGVDTYSLLGALEGKTETFAVLGCGVDVCYPSENIELYDDICKRGGIISEYLPGTKPLAWHFPQRNRIISGLSDRVVVVEAKEKSGSLITVEWALEQGKDVMAVPGRIGEKLSSGCNRLIRSGAGIITSIEDILQEFTMKAFDCKREYAVEEKTLEKDLTLLYSELRLQPKNVYELMEDTGLKYEIVVEALLKLQLMGLAEQPSENYYSKVKE